MRRVYTGDLEVLPANGIFVFGSNTQGRHGLGAAKTAITKFGAIYGLPAGMQGRSYAIITKDISRKPYQQMQKNFIMWQIEQLYFRAIHQYTDKEFYIAYRAKRANLNSYTAQEMADMFCEAAKYWDPNGVIPDNIIFEDEFLKLLKL